MASSQRLLTGSIYSSTELNKNSKVIGQKNSENVKYALLHDRLTLIKLRDSLLKSIPDYYELFCEFLKFCHVMTSRCEINLSYMSAVTDRLPQINQVVYFICI